MMPIHPTDLPACVSLQSQSDVYVLSGRVYWYTLCNLRQRYIIRCLFKWRLRNNGTYIDSCMHACRDNHRSWLTNCDKKVSLVVHRFRRSDPSVDDYSYLSKTWPSTPLSFPTLQHEAVYSKGTFLRRNIETVKIYWQYSPLINVIFMNLAMVYHVSLW
jgi:hypothetical protein